MTLYTPHPLSSFWQVSEYSCLCIILLFAFNLLPLPPRNCLVHVQTFYDLHCLHYFYFYLLSSPSLSLSSSLSLYAINHILSINDLKVVCQSKNELIKYSDHSSCVFNWAFWSPNFVPRVFCLHSRRSQKGPRVSQSSLTPRIAGCFGMII